MAVAPPASLANPCEGMKTASVESDWLSTSGLDDPFFQNSNSVIYPVLIPVYNGKVLKIRHEFVHAGLAGISIKHYYGKCYQEIEPQDDDETSTEKDSFRFDMMGEDDPFLTRLLETANVEKYEQTVTSSSSGSFEYRDEVYIEGQPLCMVPRINHRNSFWNLHRPELCKLTWGQNYVGASTVMEHLHEHLVHHGPLCMNFHTVEDRESYLKAELDEYVRLKVLAKPRDLPPDEPIFTLHESNANFRMGQKNKKCITITGKRQRRPVREMSIRYVSINDEEDEEDMVGLKVRMSKEEFCITIGKPTRQLPITVSLEEEDQIYAGESPCAGSVEGEGMYFYNWYLYAGEESYGEFPGEKCESSTDNSEVAAAAAASGTEGRTRPEPCVPLMMDEFCRAAGKVDFSDLRCNPDDF